MEHEISYVMEQKRERKNVPDTSNNFSLKSKEYSY